MSFINSSAQTNRKDKPKMLVDNAIRAHQVLVIDAEQGQNLGLMQTRAALQLAAEKGLNLVQVAPPAAGNPPTCKILDYGKFRYDESKREKASQKKQREAQIKEKEITFCPDTAVNDLRIKAKKTCEFLDDGAKVRINIKCRGREGTHLWVIQQALETFVSFIPNGAVIETAPPPAMTAKVKLFSYFIVRNEPTKK